MVKESDLEGYERMSLLEALKIQSVYSDRDDIKEMVLPEGVLDEEGMPLSIDHVSREIQRMQHALFGIYN